MAEAGPLPTKPVLAAVHGDPGDPTTGAHDPSPDRCRAGNRAAPSTGADSDDRHRANPDSGDDDPGADHDPPTSNDHDDPATDDHDHHPADDDDEHHDDDHHDHDHLNHDHHGRVAGVGTPARARVGA